MLALYQNGERLRPENGYPVRLLLPGYEGNMNVKWLRRIKVTRAPTMTKDETSQVHRPAAGRPCAAVHLPDGREVGDHAAVGGADAAGAGSLRDLRHRVARRRADPPRRRVGRRRQDLGRSGARRSPCCRRRSTRFRLPWRWDGGPAVAAEPRDATNAAPCSRRATRLIAERGSRTRQSLQRASRLAVSARAR